MMTLQAIILLERKISVALFRLRLGAVAAAAAARSLYDRLSWGPYFLHLSQVQRTEECSNGCVSHALLSC